MSTSPPDHAPEEGGGVHHEGAAASRVRADRIAADIEAIAACSEHAGGDGPDSSARLGYSRPTFSAAWRRARDYVIDQATVAGAEVRVDAAANVHIRHRNVGWDRPAWLCGSHIDSVPSGGRFDGVMGIVVPLEILRCYPDAPLELVIFAEEEGTTFGFGMIGSRLWTGAVSPDDIAALRNRHGQSVAEAGADHGLDPGRLASAAAPAPVPAPAPAPAPDGMATINPDAYLGMIEVHAEQGLSLWDGGVPVAAVDRINGRRQFEITLAGQANHAGSTGMRGRRDALVGAAELVTVVETLGRELDEAATYSVMTVGQLEITPGAVNVIPGHVRLTVDLRAQEQAILERGEQGLRAHLDRIAAARALEASCTRTEAIAPSPLDRGVVDQLVQAATVQGITLPIIPSGALHDAAIIAPHVPTAMLFVASRDGISHNPAEFSRIEDIHTAAKIVATLISGQ